MPFRIRPEQARSLRFFVYISDAKLQMFMEQIAEPIRRSIAAELKIDFKLVSLTVTSPAVDRALREKSRLAKLAVVEDYITRYQEIGDLTSARGYFTGAAELDWKPCDDNETVLFCGYSETLLIVLGGSVSNLLGRVPAAMQIGSHPYTIQAAVRRGSEYGEIGADLVAAAQALISLPQPVRFLARVISRGPLPSGTGAHEYMLATPLYIEATDSVNS
jgi:hypothetical protein